jgi:hypothetical protein
MGYLKTIGGILCGLAQGGITNSPYNIEYGFSKNRIQRFRAVDFCLSSKKHVSPSNGRLLKNNVRDFRI